MAWRVLLIQNQACLRLEKNQLAVKNEEGLFTFPLEDILAIILESPQVTMTSSLLSALQANGIVCVTCDSSHIPNGITLPFLQHSRASQVAQLQQTWSLPLRKRLWQTIVQTKISNQADCIDLTRGSQNAVRLRALCSRVASGDPQNIEAQAAKTYWRLLFGETFRRGHSDGINAALNYGYAIVRAHVARAQVAFGLIPAFGLHHDNQLNGFNLTDDVMEVFRPCVDWCVFQMIKNQELSKDTAELSKKIRQNLTAIGQSPCSYKDEIHALSHVAELLAASLVDAIRQKDPSLFICPSLADLPSQKQS